MTRALDVHAERSDSWVDEHVRAGDLVVVAQGVGEPTPLLTHLLAKAPGLEGVTLFVGLSHSGVLDDPAAARDASLLSFGAMGPLSPLVQAGTASVIPCHFSDVPRLLTARSAERIVVVLQVAPADDDGMHSLGVSVDYTFDLLDRASVVIAEVNDRMPVTSAPAVPARQLTAVVHTSRPLPAPRAAEPDDVQRRIGAHVASLVDNASTIQLGVGAVPSVVAGALQAKRGLRVHSTLVGSWLLDLARAGALDDRPGSVRISEAAGSPALHEWVAGSATVEVLPVSDMTAPARLASIVRFVAMNSAFEVDLTGQVNAEVLGTRYAGGIGGQPEFLRAAQQSPGGRAIVMLPSTAASGTRSRIVRTLAGNTVTTPRSGVDLIVTEHGVADLRGLSIDERTDAMIAVAAPEHRDRLWGER